jgi:hypothetical protein
VAGLCDVCDVCVVCMFGGSEWCVCITVQAPTSVCQELGQEDPEAEDSRRCDWRYRGCQSCWLLTQVLRDSCSFVMKTELPRSTSVRGRGP